ncbi:MAG: B12-binding domain-containing radical SAM protein [Candidatus Omnitrophota bacterium]
MRIVLICPPLMDYNNGVLIPIAMDAHRECPPYGIYLLASILRQAGHDVTIIDLIAQGNLSLDPYLYPLSSCQLVGIGTSTLSWPTARDCITNVRKYRPDVPIVLGGIHATMFDKYVLATTTANYVVRGEGEIALPTLCRILEHGGNLQDVPNLTMKLTNGTIIRNPIANLIPSEYFKSFPVPDYSQLTMGVYNGLALESSRGCPFDCSFCSTSYRKSWRAIEASEYVDRMQTILPHLNRTRGGFIHIVDDEFSIKHERATDICREIDRRHLNGNLVFDSRANDLLNEDYVATIAPHTIQFLVGCECGYDEGLQKVGKGTTTARIEGAAAVLRKFGLSKKADFSFILGLPWETKDDALKTVHFACNLYAKYGVRVLLQWYCQIPGSRLWDEQRKKGVVHEAQYDDYGFFRNLYLFRTGVSLTPDEIYEISEKILSINTLSRLMNAEGNAMVEYGHPEPLKKDFPKLSEIYNEGQGLASLREVAKVSI